LRQVGKGSILANNDLKNLLSEFAQITPRVYS